MRSIVLSIALGVAGVSGCAVDADLSDTRGELTTSGDDTDGDAVWYGDATIRTAADLAQLQGVRTITGNLTIQQSEVVRIDLPALELIGGTLHVADNAVLERLRLGRATAKSGVYARNNRALRTIDLARVGDDVIVADNERLERVTIDVTDEWIRMVRVHGNPALVIFDALQETTELGDMRLWSNGRLEHLIAPEVRSIGNHLELVGMPAMKILGLPKLESVRREMWIAGLGLTTWNGLDSLREAGNVAIIEANPHLADIGLPNLQQVNYLWIEDNPALGLIGLEKLTQVQGIRVVGNRSMPTCKVERLFARIESEFQESQGGNDDTATCR